MRRPHRVGGRAKLGGVSDHLEVVIVRWPETGDHPSPVAGVSDLLAAYHRQTEAEKGAAVADVTDLPDRYRAEVLDPRTAFADAAVLVAVSADAAVGCLVLTAPVAGRSEIKRLWTDPLFRGRGIAHGLVSAALGMAAESGADTVRLSVWRWRTGALALYERLGFTVTESWDARADLVCLERPLSPPGLSGK
jgi:ribosomal protein S18 acetylase RimI-like enzyme